MNSETKSLTAADLALCIGQQAMNTFLEGGELLTITAVNQVAVSGRDAVKRECYIPFEFIKPILRPLSDMTEEEARECYRLAYDSLCGFPDSSSCLEDWWRKIDGAAVRPASVECLGKPAVWRYLLTCGFDLFDWIPAGLAIDKTTL